MERVDNLLKLEKIISLISESVRMELEDFKALKNEEFEDFKKKKEKEYREKKEKIRREFEKEMNKLKKLHDSKISLLLSQEKSRLKAEMFSNIREEITKLVESLEGEDRKKYLIFLFEDAKQKIEGDFKVLCKKEDIPLVKEFFGGEVLEEDVDGLILESGNMRVVADVSTLFERIESDVMNFIDEKVGELR